MPKSPRNELYRLDRGALLGKVKAVASADSSVQFARGKRSVLVRYKDGTEKVVRTAEDAREFLRKFERDNRPVEQSLDAVIPLDVWGSAYHDLERRFEALATADGAVYLPNPEPAGPVDHLLVTMEPSLGGWARTREEAQAKVAAGFRNFVGYGGDFGGGESDYLIYAVRRWLGSSYHVTDISKGAQLIADANRGREARWERWWPLLRDELTLVGPRAHIWAVGGKVARFLALHGVLTTPILHYSPVAARYRISAVVGREHEFSDFKKDISQKDVIAILSGPIGDVALRERCATRLAERPLTESRLRLLFAYKQEFDTQLADVRSPSNEIDAVPRPQQA